MFNWALIQLATLSSLGKSQSDSLAMEISMSLSGVQEIFKNSRGNQLFCISWYLILIKFGGLNMLIAKFGSTIVCYSGNMQLKSISELLLGYVQKP